TFSLSPFSVTVTSPVPATATTEKIAPSGFQHLVQPQAWLWAIWPLTFTLTGLLVQAQTSVPPAKSAFSFGRPLSIFRCSFSCISLLPCLTTEVAGALAGGVWPSSVNHHTPDRLALMHEVKPLVDVFQCQRVGDHRVDLDLAVHVPVDDPRHIGAAT